MLSVMPLSFISYLKVMITLKLYVFSNVLMVPGKKKPSDFILDYCITQTIQILETLN